MFKLISFLTILSLSFCAFAYDNKDVTAISDRLAELDIQMPTAGPNDWLAMNDEDGQTLDEYLNLDFKLQEAHKYIYIQPIGKFSKDDRRVLSKIANYLEIFYGLETKIKADISSNLILEEGRRTNPMQQNLQFSAPYIIEELLDSRRPVDAAAYVGFTATDLWPGNDWNYVFGLATPDDSMGIWSLARLRSVSSGFDSKLLLRATKLASHEVGHMFGIMHNKDSKSIMNGSNHIKETDSTPLYLSSVDFPKLFKFTDFDIPSRYRALSEWCEKHGFESEASEFNKRAKLFED